MDLTKAFISVLVIINPLGAIPIYISLSMRHAPEDKLKIVRTASIAVGIILLISALIGEYLLRLFGISIASFRVAGGILVLLLAISMMNAQTAPARQTKEEQQEAFSKENIAVVPLALPLLAGPGAISTMIIAANNVNRWYDFAGLALVSVVVAVIIWGALKLAEPISQFLGRTGINIATRIMGLLLAAISIEFITDGIRVLLPGLS